MKCVSIARKHITKMNMEDGLEKTLKKTTPYTCDVCVSWLIENGEKVSYELYMNDDDCCCDISVPIQFCPKCGRKFA